MDRTARRRRSKNDDLSIPATIRVKQDNGKVRVFRRRELVGLVSIPGKLSEQRREAERMPSLMGYWNYYAEIYRSRYERVRMAYEKFEALRRAAIARCIIKGEGYRDRSSSENWGPEFATPENINGIYYQGEDVAEWRDRLERARARWHVLRVVADVLKEKNWNLRAIVQSANRGEH